MFSPGMNILLSIAKWLAVLFNNIKRNDWHHMLIRCQIKGFLNKNRDWFSIIDILAPESFWGDC